MMNTKQDTAVNPKPCHSSKATSETLEREQYAPRPMPHGGYSGAPPSNTAPSTCNSSTKIFRSAIDSLYLSYPGNITEETSIRLKKLKELAQSRNPGDQSLAQWKHNDHIFNISGGGSGLFAYVMSDPSFRIEISSMDTKSPLAYCRLASKDLTFDGPHAVEKELRGIVEALGPPEDEARVSRVDLCVDFVTDCEIGHLAESDWVSRACHFSQHSVYRHFSGWSIGQGGNLSCRLYNKTLEIEKKSHKTYMFNIWKKQGWDGKQDVWRLEFQFKRESLRGFDIKSFTQLMNSLSGLWQYATEKWLRLTLPSESDSTQSRWPLHPMWQVLSQADWGMPPDLGKRPPPEPSGPTDRHLFLNGVGSISSFMAREKITDVDQGIRDFYEKARYYHLDRAEKFGDFDFDGYILDKVAQKARRYSSMKNNEVAGIDDPGDAAVAREYRNRSDG